jgi:type IV secretory pathway VirB4 component
MDDEIAILSGREATTRIFDRVKDLHAADGSPVDVLRTFQVERKREAAA